MSRVPLVLLPGLLLNKRMWQPQIEALWEIADCWVPDLSQADTMAEMAQQVLARPPNALPFVAALVASPGISVVLRRSVLLHVAHGAKVHDFSGLAQADVFDLRLSQFAGEGELSLVGHRLLGEVEQ